VQTLVEVETRIEKQAAGATEQLSDVKGKIVSCIWYMEKQGYAKETIRTTNSALRILQQRGANLLDTDSVKEVIMKQKWSDNRRKNVINSYNLFLKVNGMHWEKPKCKITRKIPFIPTEQEIDALIAGCNKKLATFLQLLKETAMRCGEAKRLKWTDVDLERRIIILNEPEKNSNPRIWNTSHKLTAMLNALPKTSPKIFGEGPISSLKSSLQLARRRLAEKLQNPRLQQIHFHTLRHWKATTEYHRTKDPLHVAALLGHKKLENIQIYVQLDRNLFKDADDGFTCRVAHNIGEAIELIEVGFEYVTGEYNDGGKLFRKRK
jgi:integrase